MDKKQFKFLFAPIGVAIGITVFIYISMFVASSLDTPNIYHLFPFIPTIVFMGLGTILLLIFLPMFVAGIYYLDRRGAVGQSDTLRTYGIYQYTRNPMYVGVSMTICGIGLLLLNTGILIGGIAWFHITYFQCKREEKELAERFGEEYQQYKKRTPMFFPNIRLLLSNLFH